jgi:hypothetical protein
MLFHCQQAPGKAMPGFLTAHDRIFRTNHDLDELADPGEAFDLTWKEVLNPARDFTVFAWEFPLSWRCWRPFPGGSQASPGRSC